MRLPTPIPDILQILVRADSNGPKRWDQRLSADRQNRDLAGVLVAKCLIDDEHVLITSANFTGRDQNRNTEAGVVIHHKDYATALERPRRWKGCGTTRWSLTELFRRKGAIAAAKRHLLLNRTIQASIKQCASRGGRTTRGKTVWHEWVAPLAE